MTNRTAVGVGEGITAKGKPSRLTDAVADTAAYLIKNNFVDQILFAGGFGYRFKSRPPTTEAEAMRDRAISKGVNIEKIMIEPNSYDTVTNLYTSKKRIESIGGIKEITLIASWQHMYRTEVFANWIYGPNYKITTISSPDGIWGEEMMNSIQAEKLSQEFALTIWRDNGIIPGDHEGIYRVLQQTHPFYTPNPILSEKQREMMRKIDELRQHCRKFSENPEV